MCKADVKTVMDGVSEHWSPRVVATVDCSDVKVADVQGTKKSTP
jgi:hypothetical protein